MTSFTPEGSRGLRERGRRSLHERATLIGCPWNRSAEDSGSAGDPAVVHELPLGGDPRARGERDHAGDPGRLVVRPAGQPPHDLPQPTSGIEPRRAAADRVHRGPYGVVRRSCGCGAVPPRHRRREGYHPHVSRDRRLAGAAAPGRRPTCTVPSGHEGREHLEAHHRHRGGGVPHPARRVGPRGLLGGPAVRHRSHRREPPGRRHRRCRSDPAGGGGSDRGASQGSADAQALGGAQRARRRGGGPRGRGAGAWNDRPRDHAERP